MHDGFWRIFGWLVVVLVLVFLVGLARLLFGGEDIPAGDAPIDDPARVSAAA